MAVACEEVVGGLTDVVVVNVGARTIEDGEGNVIGTFDDGGGDSVYF